MCCWSLNHPWNTGTLEFSHLRYVWTLLCVNLSLPASLEILTTTIRKISMAALIHLKTDTIPESTSDILANIFLINAKHANYMTMTTSGLIMSWPDYLKTNGNVNIKLWDFDCLHFAQYISISPHGIDCKQTWCKKIYCMDRFSWLKPLNVKPLNPQRRTC